MLLPSSGAVYVKGYNTADETKIWEIRQAAGMVFQNPDNQLVSSIVEDDVAFGPENLGIEPAKSENGWMIPFTLSTCMRKGKKHLIYYPAVRSRELP